MELKDLVPPLELCKLIPVGEFEDSAIVWLNIQYTTIPWKVVERRISRYKMERNKKSFPAPTLQEILQRLKLDVLSGIEHHGDMYVSNRYLGCFEDKSGATAALKLWLKLKGIEG